LLYRGFCYAASGDRAWLLSVARGLARAALFLAASSASPQHQRLLHGGETYAECLVEVGLEQISLVDLPAPSNRLHSLSAA
jgi:ferrous iron transport protein B